MLNIKSFILPLYCKVTSDPGLSTVFIHSGLKGDLSHCYTGGLQQFKLELFSTDIKSMEINHFGKPIIS